MKTKTILGYDNHTLKRSIEPKRERERQRERERERDQET